MEELKPCPFCGGEAHTRQLASIHGRLYSVSCLTAGCYGHETQAWYEVPRDAIEAWNRRAERTCNVGCYPPGYEDSLHYEVCSECGTILTASRPGDRHSKRANYCPSCGARVEVNR